MNTDRIIPPLVCTEILPLSTDAAPEQDGETGDVRTAGYEDLYGQAGHLASEVAGYFGICGEGRQ